MSRLQKSANLLPLKIRNVSLPNLWAILGERSKENERGNLTMNSAIRKRFSKGNLKADLLERITLLQTLNKFDLNNGTSQLKTIDQGVNYGALRAYETVIEIIEEEI